MAYTTSDLMLVEQRLADAERRVVRARQTIARMVELGQPTDHADEVVETLEMSLRSIAALRDRILEQLGSGTRRPMRPPARPHLRLVARSG